MAIITADRNNALNSTWHFKTHRDDERAPICKRVVVESKRSDDNSRRISNFEIRCKGPTDDSEQIRVQRIVRVSDREVVRDRAVWLALPQKHDRRRRHNGRIVDLLDKEIHVLGSVEWRDS